VTTGSPEPDCAVAGEEVLTMDRAKQLLAKKQRAGIDDHMAA